MSYSNNFLTQHGDVSFRRFIGTLLPSQMLYPSHFESSTTFRRKRKRNRNRNRNRSKHPRTLNLLRRTVLPTAASQRAGLLFAPGCASDSIGVQGLYLYETLNCSSWPKRVSVIVIDITLHDPSLYYLPSLYYKNTESLGPNISIAIANIRASIPPTHTQLSLRLYRSKSPASNTTTTTTTRANTHPRPTDFQTPSPSSREAEAQQQTRWEPSSHA